MTKLKQNANFAKFQGHKGYFRTNLKVIYYYKAFGSRYLYVTFSHERKSEWIERKFKTQNPTLSDLLRKTAELTLNDMIQLLFTRLPTFTEENLPLLKKLKMRNSGQNEGKSKRRRTKDSSEARKQRQLNSVRI